MATSTGSFVTSRRILDGAVSAISRFGSQKLSMVDLSRESGVSRGTLYRYFATKEDVLDQLGCHLAESFASDLETAVALRPDVEDRVAVVTQVVLDFVGKPTFSTMQVVDPVFLRSFFDAHFDDLVAAVAGTLAPVAASAAAGLPRFDVPTVAEVMVRFGISACLVPAGAGQLTAETMHRALLRMLGTGERAHTSVAVPRQPVEGASRVSRSSYRPLSRPA